MHTRSTDFLSGGRLTIQVPCFMQTSTFQSVEMCLSIEHENRQANTRLFLYKHQSCYGERVSRPVTAHPTIAMTKQGCSGCCRLAKNTVQINSTISRYVFSEPALTSTFLSCWTNSYTPIHHATWAADACPTAGKVRGRNES